MKGAVLAHKALIVREIKNPAKKCRVKGCMVVVVPTGIEPVS